MEERRRLRRAETVEAAVARSAGLAVSDQVQMARNMSVWCAGLLAFAAACVAPGAIANAGSGWGLAEAITAIPAAVLIRRSFLLQRSLSQLREVDDPAITDGDDELAHLRELVRSLEGRPALRVGKTALTAAVQGYAQKRLMLERRSHVEALLNDADPHLAQDALQRDLQSCDDEIAGVDRQLEDLVEAVAHLASSSDQSGPAAIASVRDAADAVSSLASAFDELRRQP